MMPIARISGPRPRVDRAGGGMERPVAHTMKQLSFAMPTRVVAATLSVLLAALTACSKPKIDALADIGGLMPPLEFTLTSDAGTETTARDFRGKVILLYFGYTHCPDVCPTTLARLARAIHSLGADAAKVRVLFVSVDPARDTVAVLKRYVSAFGPEFVGLRGSDEALERLSKRYRVAYSREKPGPDGDYAVTHSSAVFIFDGNGEVRLLATSSDSAAEITKGLRQLLSSSALAAAR
jgi:protein SCO1/2